MRWPIRLWTVVFVVSSVAAADTLDRNTITELMKRVPAAELPACAAELVKNCSAHQPGMVSNVVSAAIKINSVATPLVIGAVAREAPEGAALAAQVAAVQQPEQIQLIARAAAGVVPARAGEIVVAMLRVNTNSYRGVALSAARVAPAASVDILKAVAEVRPDLKPYLDKELEARRHSKISVERCLDRSELALARARSLALSLNPFKTNAGQDLSTQTGGASAQAAGQKPPRGNGNGNPGGRNYARP